MIRRQLRTGRLDARRAELALADLLELPLHRVSHRALVARSWQLRQNVTVYDGVHVALAEFLDAVLVTADARLANAPGVHCRMELLGQ